MRLFAAAALLGWLLVCGAPAQAAHGLCDDASGQPIPNCTVGEPGDFMSPDDSGFEGIFAFFVFVMIVGGIGTALYRMSAARSIATKSGLDPDDAAKLALLEEHGLTAAYVMSNLHPKEETPAADEPDRTVEQRLAELDELRDKGLVTQAEYDERRAAILGSL